MSWSERGTKRESGCAPSGGVRGRCVAEEGVRLSGDRSGQRGGRGRATGLAAGGRGEMSVLSGGAVVERHHGMPGEHPGGRPPVPGLASGPLRGGEPAVCGALVTAVVSDDRDEPRDPGGGPRELGPVPRGTGPVEDLPSRSRSSRILTSTTSGEPLRCRSNAEAGYGGLRLVRHRFL